MTGSLQVIGQPAAELAEGPGHRVGDGPERHGLAAAGQVVVGVQAEAVEAQQLATVCVGDAQAGAIVRRCASVLDAEAERSEPDLTVSFVVAVSHGAQV